MKFYLTHLHDLMKTFNLTMIEYHGFINLYNEKKGDKNQSNNSNEIYNIYIDKIKDFF